MSFLFFVLFFFQTVRVSDDAQIKTLFESRDKLIKQLVGPEGSTYAPEQRRKLQDIINNIIDFEAMGKIALAAAYDAAKPEQRKEFVDLFSRIIRDQSLKDLSIYRAKIEYSKIEVTGSKASVLTMASLKDVRTPVSYNLEKKNGTWVITDMAIDNVSTAQSYFTSFQKLIKKKGFDGLLESLRKRVGEIQKS
jgi:phospholipid transport system substrate-binding protein